MSVTTQIQELQATLPTGVTLVAVSKFHPVEAIQEAYNAGQRIFGESRPQEMAAKVPQLPGDIEWHMIGHLQTNKVKMIAPFVALIHSVDSPRLLCEIERQAERLGRTIDILFEVHLAEDESKSGWDSKELLDYIATGEIAKNKPEVETPTEDPVVEKPTTEEPVEQPTEDPTEEPATENSVDEPVEEPVENPDVEEPVEPKQEDKVEDISVKSARPVVEDKDIPPFLRKLRR